MWLEALWQTLRWFHGNEQREFVLARETGRLLDLHLGDLVGKGSGGTRAAEVDVEHDLDGLLLRHVEDRYQHPHHELHGGVVVVVEQDPEERRFLDLLP